jgi:glycosyltransferase involved in cell wall biosynthesis
VACVLEPDQIVRILKHSLLRLPMKPLVSILIPAHNAEQWIADTLRSALAQTWDRKEIIVVDDGSSDNTVQIAEKLASDGVRIVAQKNQGAAAARNSALTLSQGDYIQWLDADDLLATDKIANQLALADSRNPRILLSSAWGRFMYRYYRASFVPTALWCDLTPLEWLLRKMEHNIYMQTATWLVSRELAEAAGPWDTRLIGDDDGEYFCRVLAASVGTRFVPESKVYYRGPGLAFRSLSHIGDSNVKQTAHWISMQLHISCLRSMEESPRVRAACLRYLQTSLIYFYPQREDILCQARQLAGELGGSLNAPDLSWKYSWMQSTFGWNTAKQGQQFLLNVAWSGRRLWDKLLFRIEN